MTAGARPVTDRIFFTGLFGVAAYFGALVSLGALYAAFYLAWPLACLVPIPMGLTVLAVHQMLASWRDR